jgi:hydroxyversicolorone monooxygenase
LEYIEGTCDKWNLRRDVQFNTAVVGAEWLEDEGKWKVRVEKNGKEMDEFADVLIMASGFLK